MPPFHYAERRPAPALAPWIRNAWRMEVHPGAPPLHHVPPDGCTSLVRLAGVVGAPVVVSGPWTRPLTVPVAAGQVHAGIRLQPGAAALVLGLDPRTLVNTARPIALDSSPLAAALDRVIGAGGGLAALCEALDNALEPLAPTWPAPDPVVSAAVARLSDSAGELPIAELAARLGVSPRTLRRRFGAASGISPKQFARIRRLLRAAWGMAQGGESWGRLAAQAGYADQPHLTREMVDLTGLTPAGFAARFRMFTHDGAVP